MKRLLFPLEFLDVRALQDRWQCGLYIIQALAELNKIKFFVKPVALEIALETHLQDKEQYDTALANLVNTPIDHRDIYRIFKNKDGTNAVRNFIIGKQLLTIELSDLVIPITDVEVFETKYENTQDESFKLMSDDFTCVLFKGREYTFGGQQAKVLKRLWQAHQDGTPWVYGKTILAEIGAGSLRIQSIFRRNTYWRKLVLSDGNGKYRLNIDSKPRERSIA